MSIGKQILLVGFLGLIFSVGAITLLTEDRASSPYENRTLAQMPAFEFDKLKNGELFKQFETYYSDQFFKRDHWVKLFTKWELLNNKTFVNGLHVSKENVIISNPSSVTPENELVQSAKSLNELGAALAAQDSKLYYFPVPAKVHMLNKSFPSYVHNNGSKNLNGLISKLNDSYVTYNNIPDYFNNNYSYEEIEDFYFNSDHHWNMKGAFQGYSYMMELINKDFKQIPANYHENSYEYSCAKQELIGSWNKNLYMLVDSNDIPCYFTPKTYSFNDYIVYNGNIDKTKIIPYDKLYASGLKTAQESMEYYQAYTNDRREINISNKKSVNNLNTLIIKDSYANPIIYQMAHHFKNTTIFDVRFNEDRSVLEFLNNSKIKYDIVIVLYNSGNLHGNMYIFD